MSSRRHYDHCTQLMADLDSLRRLVERIRDGDTIAAREMVNLCRHVSYDGPVIYLRIDDAVGPILEPDESEIEIETEGAAERLTPRTDSER